MDPLLAGALIGGLQTGLSPAQQVNISDYYQQPNPEQTKADNTLLYIAIFAAVIVAAGTIYFVTKK